jgi:hypothetical protein
MAALHVDQRRRDVRNPVTEDSVERWANEGIKPALELQCKGEEVTQAIQED